MKLPKFEEFLHSLNQEDYEELCAGADIEKDTNSKIFSISLALLHLYHEWLESYDL